MRRLTVWAAVLVTAGALVVACGDNGGDADEPDLAPSVDVRATDRANVRATERAGDDETLAVGGEGRFEIDDEFGAHDVTVLVRDAQYDVDAPVSPPDVAGLVVTVRIENRGDEDEIVDFNVVCADGSDAGRYLYDAPDALGHLEATPGGSFDEGTMLLGVPEGCRQGAVLEASLTGAFAGELPKEIRWALPAFE